MICTIRIYALALKYWLRDGDSWDSAVRYARRITEPFYKKGRK